MFENLTELSYKTLQQGKTSFALIHKYLGTQLRNLLHPSLANLEKGYSPEILLKIQAKIDQLLKTDWQDAEKGIYPISLLFDDSWEDFFRYYPICWLDTLQVWERMKVKKFQEFSPEIDQQGYPKYYLQNFHYQTDGYLSELSANLYDIQVELLFSGTTDAMRRRILAPLKHHLENFNYLQPKQIRILDVACGTGRTLKLIRAALPQASLFGIDLSSAYLSKANESLSQITGKLPQLIQTNAEELPYIDNYFHAVISVFLFHELPAKARQAVIEQCFRVTKPGGIFILCDSIQINDSPELEASINGFVATFHEPYYKNYLSDNLVERLEKAGFENIETQTYFVSKYFIAHKPM
jgi:ubiquinone/menaquinone biosynthesis C-methylase UbiE